jgi:hypothetical protein
MYLLNTETFTLHYFSEPHIPDYAILSHTWNKVEVSFAEMQANKNIQEAAAFSPFSDASIAERMSWVFLASASLHCMGKEIMRSSGCSKKL